MPVCRNLVGGGRRLFSPPEDGRGVQGLRVAGEEGEPGQAPEAGDAMGLGGTQQEAQAVTPPASPKHRQRPPGSITKGPGERAPLTVGTIGGAPFQTPTCRSLTYLQERTCESQWRTP